MVIVRTGLDNNKEDRPIDASLCWNTTLKKIGEAITDDKATIKGGKKVWQTVTIDFKGPQAVESDSNPNPFLDYRLQVIFTGPGGQVYNVPGFFDGDGNGGASGNVWRVRFTPDQSGEWSYKAVLKKGKDIAVNLDNFFYENVSLNGSIGVLEIATAAKTAEGFLGKGKTCLRKWGFLFKNFR